jgi:hypothetical protein
MPQPFKATPQPQGIIILYVFKALTASASKSSEILNKSIKIILKSLPLVGKQMKYLDMIGNKGLTLNSINTAKLAAIISQTNFLPGGKLFHIAFN